MNSKKLLMIGVDILLAVVLIVLLVMINDGKSAKHAAEASASAGSITGKVLQTSTESNPLAKEETEPEKEPEKEPETSVAPMVETVRLSASGDNLIHNGLYEDAYRRAANDPSNSNEYDFSFCYAQMQDFYNQYDVNWINQETLVNDQFEPSNFPYFSTPGQMANDLYDAGFRVVNLSNNHVYDKGGDGIDATLEKWATMPEDMLVYGLYDRDTWGNIGYKTTNGITIAYLGYTEMTNGIPTPHSASNYGVIYLSDRDIIRRQVEEARKNADFVVVSCHWGTEGSYYITDAQREEAQFLADLGVDLIIGSHPHVVQDGAWLNGPDGKKTFVIYSLGNYLNYQDEPQHMVGLILSAELEKVTSSDGSVNCSVKKAELYPVINHFDRFYKQGRMYLLKDYTEDLAATHGLRDDFPDFGLEEINNIINTHVSAEFLA